MSKDGLYSMGPSAFDCHISKDRITKCVQKNILDPIDGSKEEQINRVIKNTSYVSMACAMMGAPFDNFVFFQVIQQLLGYQIGKIHGYEFKDTSLLHLLTRTAGIFGLGYIGHKGYKIIKASNFLGDIPLVGEYIPTPVGRASAAFAINYAIGHIVDSSYEFVESDQAIGSFLKDKISQIQTFRSEGEGLFQEAMATNPPDSETLLNVFGEKIRI